MKRGLYVALGVVLLVVGLSLAALGTTVALSVGSDDAISTAAARVRGTGVAVVAEGFRVETGSIPVPQDIGSLTLTVTGRDGRTMFVGTAKPSDVDTYLAGAPYDVVVDLTAGQKATTRKVPGSQRPQPPGNQGFWTAQSSGAPATLTAKVPDGETLVVMNADAKQLIDADLVVTLRVAGVWAYAWVVAAVGVVLALLAVLLFWRARVAGRRGAAPSGATVLPGVTPQTVPAAPLSAPVSTPTVVLAPVGAEVVPAAPSAALAALVADAAEVPDDATVELPVVPVVPVVPEVPMAPVVPAGAADQAPSETTAPSQDQSSDVGPAGDLLFDELVAERGADPVHDALPTAGGAASDPAGPASAGASGVDG